MSLKLEDLKAGDKVKGGHTKIIYEVTAVGREGFLAINVKNNEEMFCYTLTAYEKIEPEVTVYRHTYIRKFSKSIVDRLTRSGWVEYVGGDTTNFIHLKTEEVDKFPASKFED